MKPLQPKRRGDDPERAFTRLELLAVLAVLALLALMVLPALANNKTRSQRLLCVSNLRQIGQAFQLFGNDHDELLPWRVSVANGGTWGSALANNAWFHFSWVSNELRTPVLLVCPRDNKRVANTWGGSPDGGFLNPRFRNAALSYFAGMDAFPHLPGALVAGDFNVRSNGVGSCSSGITPVVVINPAARLGLGLGPHADAGNFLFYDGQVQQLSSEGFIRALDEPNRVDDNGSIHHLIP